MSLRSITIDEKCHSRVPAQERPSKSVSIHEACLDKSYCLGEEQREQREQRDERTSQLSIVCNIDIADRNEKMKIDEDLNMIDSKRYGCPEVNDRSSDHFDDRYEETLKFAELLRHSIC